MQEEPFLRAQPSRQWLHQLLGHKELLVSGTLPRFFGTRRFVPRLQRSTRGSANTSLHVGRKEMMCLGGTAWRQKCLQRPQNKQRC